MLILAACWQDDRLREAVQRWSFPALMDRTILFLGKLADLSPTCRADHRILVNLRMLTFGHAHGGFDVVFASDTVSGFV